MSKVTETIEQRTFRLMTAIMQFDHGGRISIERLKESPLFLNSCALVEVVAAEERMAIADYLDSVGADEYAGFEIADAIREGKYYERQV